jgi:hypothetical protein
VLTFLYNRDNTGITIGITLPGKTPMPFILKASTYTPLAMTIGGTTYSSFYPFGITLGEDRRYVPGFVGDNAGIQALQQRKAVALNYPGAAETVASGINDNSTIVGYYSKNLPPNERKHGFIYSNGKWASLSYPNNKSRCKAPILPSQCKISQGLGAAHALGAEHVFSQFQRIYAGMEEFRVTGQNRSTGVLVFFE